MADKTERGSSLNEGMEVESVADMSYDKVFAEEAKKMQEGKEETGWKTVQKLSKEKKEENIKGGEKAKQGAPKAFCHVCNSVSHTVAECPERKLKMEKAICYKCTKVGHFAKDCKNEVMCYRCKKEGHTQKECTSKDQAQIYVKLPTPMMGDGYQRDRNNPWGVKSMGVKDTQAENEGSRAELQKKMNEEGKSLAESVKESGNVKSFIVITVNEKGSVKVQTESNETGLSTQCAKEYQKLEEEAKEVQRKMMENAGPHGVYHEMCPGEEFTTTVAALQINGNGSGLKSVYEQVVKDVIYMQGGQPSQGIHQRSPGQMYGIPFIRGDDKEQTAVTMIEGKSAESTWMYWEVKAKNEETAHLIGGRIAAAVKHRVNENKTREMMEKQADKVKREFVIKNPEGVAWTEQQVKGMMEATMKKREVKGDIIHVSKDGQGKSTFTISMDETESTRLTETMHITVFTPGFKAYAVHITEKGREPKTTEEVKPKPAEDKAKELKQNQEKKLKEAQRKWKLTKRGTDSVDNAEQEGEMQVEEAELKQDDKRKTDENSGTDGKNQQVETDGAMQVEKPGEEQVDALKKDEVDQEMATDNEKREVNTGKNDDHESMEEEENTAEGQKVDADMSPQQEDNPADNSTSKRKVDDAMIQEQEKKMAKIAIETGEEASNGTSKDQQEETQAHAKLRAYKSPNSSPANSPIQERREYGVDKAGDKVRNGKNRNGYNNQAHIIDRTRTNVEDYVPTQQMKKGKGGTPEQGKHH